MEPKQEENCQNNSISNNNIEWNENIGSNDKISTAAVNVTEFENLFSICENENHHFLQSSNNINCSRSSSISSLDSLNLHNNNDTTSSSSALQRKKSQSTYRYGLGLVCAGTLLNWFGFAQSHFEPLRYFGVVCVFMGSLCVLIALCHWLGKPSLLSSPSRASSFQEEYNNSRLNCDVHIINIPSHIITSTSPMMTSSRNPLLCLKPPPDYEEIIKSKVANSDSNNHVNNEVPPSYDEAVLLNLTIHEPEPVQ